VHEAFDPEELAREARLAQAAEARSRRGDWDQLGAEEASLGSTLERLAADGSAVCLGTVGGCHRGSVAGLGPDHVRLADHGRWCYLRLTAALTVEAAGSHDGPRPVRVNRTFVEALSRHVGEAMTLVLADGAAHTGTVTAVGPEIVTLARDGPAGPLYASSSAVAAALGEGSG
jgi:hypothetical protein